MAEFAEIYLARLKEEFDPFGDVDTSPVRYAATVVNVTEFLLEKLDTYEEEHSAALAEIKKLNLPAEFKVLPGVYISKSRAEMKKIHRQAAALLSDLQTADDLEKLAALESKPRPSFTLLAEVLVEKVNLIVIHTPQDIETYERHANFLKLASKFVYQPLYSLSDYSTPRYYTPLLELWRYVAGGHLLERRVVNSTLSEYLLERFTDFRNELDALYRRNNGFNHNSEERDFATAPVIDEFRKNVGRIAMSLKSAEEQRWLENWADSLTV